MNTRKTSHSKTYGRQLQLETLEKRCLLALTAFSGVDAGGICDPPTGDADTVIVAKAIPADETIEIVCACDDPADVTEGVYNETAAETEILECVIDATEPMVDLTFVSDDPSQYIFDFTAVQRTLDDETNPGDETTSEPTDVIVTFSVQPQQDDAGVTDDVSDDMNTGEKPTADGDAEPPVIYYMGPMVETVINTEAKPTDCEPSSGPIVFHPTNDSEETDSSTSPESDNEEPVIYTLGGEETTNNESHTDASHSDSAPRECTPSAHLSRQQRRERKAERIRERHNDKLAAILERRANKQLSSSTFGSTSKKHAPAPTDADDTPIGAELEHVISSAFKSKHHGRRSGGRR